MERRKTEAKLNTIQVKPGEIIVTMESQPLISVVGRNVSVCIWDKSSNIAGMNNFAEPSVYDGNKATARFGNVSMLKLVDMIKEKCPGGVFEAQIFGGARIEQENGVVGEANVDMARKILKSKNILVVSEDVGGNKGRKIMFDTESGHVAVLKVHDLRKEDWGW